MGWGSAIDRSTVSNQKIEFDTDGVGNFAFKPKGKLPDGYTEVDHLLTNNALSVIDSGVTWRDNISVEATLNAYTGYPRSVTFGGAFSGVGDGISGGNAVDFFTFWHSGSWAKKPYHISGACGTGVLFDDYAEATHTYKVLAKNGAGKMWIDGVLVSEGTGTVSIKQSRTLYLCGYNYGGSYNATYAGGFHGEVGKIILREGETVLAEFVPCYRNSDNKTGFYNLTNSSFVTSLGNDFIKP